MNLKGDFMKVKQNQHNEKSQRQNITFILNDHKNPEFHHDSLEILFVLSGMIHMSVGDEEFSMKSEDLVVIDPYQMHSINVMPGSNCLSMMISTSLIYEIYPLFQDMDIRCKSFLSSENQKEHVDRIRHYYASIFSYHYKGEVRFQLDMYGELFSLLGILIRHFSKIRTQDKANTQTDTLNRIQSITKYINQNYQNEIVLSILAKDEFLTPQYLSRLFQKNMNMTLTQYVTMVRLNHAYTELSHTDHSITEIAYNNGFKNASSFITYFQQRYNITPGLFKKKNKEPLVPILTKEEQIDDIKTYDTFSALLKYTDVLEDVALKATVQIQLKHIEVDVLSTGKKLQHKWRNLINIGYAKDGLNAAIQQQLIEVQRTIGFRYLRFHGLFNDDMMVYNENKDGSSVLNFTYVDLLFDFILSIDMLPYIELSYMPSRLARDVTSVGLRQSIISMPKDMEKWNELVRKLIKHCIVRYGIDCVREWYFILWNNGLGSNAYKDEEYLELYESTYKTIKGIDDRLRVGSPINPSSNHETQRFLEFCVNQKCIPNFISMHCYSCVFEDKEDDLIKLIENDEAYYGVVSRDEAFLSHVIDNVKLMLKACQLDKTEIVLDEWNSNIWQRDLCNDTCYKAAFIVKNIVDNYDRISAFGYWTLSDFMEELYPSKDIFHGGFGLFTYNGIPKSCFNGMLLLRGLGDKLIQKGDGYLITSDSKGIQILLYNYCHYDKLYRHRHVTHMDTLNRYNVFSTNDTKQYQLTLNGLRDGEYLLRKYKICREGGSAFDKWLEMGAPLDLGIEEQTYLTMASKPIYTVDRVSVQEALRIECILKPHEVQLFKISEI